MIDEKVLEWQDKYGTVWSLHCYIKDSPLDHLTIHCFLKDPMLAEKGRKGEANFSLNSSGGPSKEYGELEYICTHANFRHRGLASYLIQLGTQWLKSHGKRGMWGRLFEHHDTHANKLFYEQNGFSVRLDDPEAENSKGMVILEF